MSEEYCANCQQQIIPQEWRKSGWGEGPHCGLGICGCEIAFDFPVLQEGDLIVDRNYWATHVKHTTYGYRGGNIMTVQRPNSDGIEVVIWERNK